ncbi:SEC-C domain-containing protein [Candidatus Dependentiae bacterium]|nr:SEC-C domain-containing protein [Candidatus Dependentiae bacterium]
MRRIGRKKLCPCGSGKKYINCCYKKNKAINKTTLSKAFKKEFPEFTIVPTSPKEQKMSEVLFEFAMPLTDKIEDEDDVALSSAVHLAAIAWNASFFSIEEREKLINEEIDDYITDEKDREITKAILFGMMIRREEHFTDIKRLIVDLEITNKGGDLHLDVISGPLTKK